MGEAGLEERLRSAAFAHLDALVARSPDGALSSAELNAFSFEGRPTRLVVQSGIWKPAMLGAALTIRTTYTRPDRQPPYADDIAADGLIRYKYRGTDPQHSDNRALRTAMAAGLPLAYFVGVAKGVYVPRYPVWIVGEDATACAFSVAVDEGQRLVDLAALGAPERGYVARLTRARLHQAVFRARVLRAYRATCAICRLRHADLLDAAHIVPDGQPQGDPVVPNGLSLCKIHHAAYDRNIIGVRPDLTIEVQPRVLAEIDGPMLRHGIQEMAGSALVVPRDRFAQPDRSRLALRYEEFRKAG